ncbi:MAG: hypothetical protein M1325_02305 [Actinobacteria bacterium]|nr:hypothetical protein [Actinomycetota bacterium]
MARRTARAPLSALVVAVLLVLLVTVPVACNWAASSPDGTQTTETSVSTGSSTTSTALPPAYATPESNAYTRDLKRTALAAAKLADELSQAGVAPDDPRAATVYALRARAQAITARKALLEKQPQVADEAAREMRSLLARAGATAKDATAEALARVDARMDALGVPSSHPEQAAAVLDDIIADLAPLLPAETTSTTHGAQVPTTQ